MLYNDKKGVEDYMNLDLTFSSLDLVWNIGELTSQISAELFYENYNKGKKLLHEG